MGWEYFGVGDSWGVGSAARDLLNVISSGRPVRAVANSMPPDRETTMASAHYRNRIAEFYPQAHPFDRRPEEPAKTTTSALRRATSQIGKICGRPNEPLDHDSVTAERGKLLVVATVLFGAGVATIVGALPSLIETGAAVLSSWVGLSPGVAMMVAAGGFLLLGVLAVAAAVVRISRSVQESSQAADDLRWRILFLEESVRRLERARPSNH